MLVRVVVLEYLELEQRQEALVGPEYQMRGTQERAAMGVVVRTPGTVLTQETLEVLMQAQMEMVPPQEA